MTVSHNDSNHKYCPSINIIIIITYGDSLAFSCRQTIKNTEWIETRLKTDQCLLMGMWEEQRMHHSTAELQVAAADWSSAAAVVFCFSPVLCSLPSVSTVWVKKNPPRGFVAIFPKRLRIFPPNFTCLLCVPIYARLRIFSQLPATLMKLCHIQCDHPVHIMCAKCPPSAKTYAGIFWHISETVRNF